MQTTVQGLFTGGERLERMPGLSLLSTLQVTVVISYPPSQLSVNNDNNNGNGDLYKALTKISTTRFKIAIYK